MSKTKEFLKNFKDRLFLFGSKEGRQAKYDESKKSFLGMPLPEFGVSEFLNLPDTSKARERQKTEKQNQQIEQAKKNAEFKRKLEEAQGGNLNLNAGSIKAEDVDYGPKRRAGDLLEIYFIKSSKKEFFRFTETNFPKVDIKEKRITIKS